MTANIEVKILIGHNLDTFDLTIYEGVLTIGASDEIDYEIEQIVGRIVRESESIVKCKYNDPSKNAYFISLNLVRPYSVLILNDQSQSPFSLRKREVCISYKDGAHPCLHLLVFETNHPKIFSNDIILNILALIGKLYKQIKALESKDPRYVWELAPVFKAQEIKEFLELLPETIRPVFEEPMNRSLCYSENGVHIDPLFPMRRSEIYSTRPIYILEYFLRHEILNIIHRNRSQRGQKALLQPLNNLLSNSINNMVLTVNFLKDFLSVAKFYVSYAEGTFHLLKYLLSTYSSVLTSVELRRVLNIEYTTLYVHLNYIKDYLEFFENKLSSLEEMVVNTFEITENITLTWIEFFVLVIGVINLLAIFSGVMSASLSSLFSFFLSEIHYLLASILDAFSKCFF